MNAIKNKDNYFRNDEYLYLCENNKKLEIKVRKMNEKKYLIIIPTKKIGGTNTSLNEFVTYLAKKRVSVDILCLDHQGNFIPDKCSILSEDMILKALISPKKAFLSANIKEKISISLLYLLQPLKYKLCCHELNKITNINEYDVIIAYEEGETTKFVSNIVFDKKIAWIHCDYMRLYEKKDIKIYKNYSKIICVSNTTRNSFIKCFPEFNNKTFRLYNLLNVDTILNKSKSVIDYKKDKFLIISVGRLDRVKQFDKLPIIAKQLKEKGLEFEWLLIGDGSRIYKKEILEEIERHSVNDYFKLIGEIKNPYPYMLLADLVVCSSISEACPYVIKEAMVLNKFIISNDFTSANEMLNEYTNSCICRLDKFCDAIFKIYVERRLEKKYYLIMKMLIKI